MRRSSPLCYPYLPERTLIVPGMEFIMKCRKGWDHIMSTIIILVTVGLLVWLYTMGYLLQAILCFGAVLGVCVLHEKLGANVKKQLYGIPFGCALAFGLILWLFGGRWYLCLAVRC